MKRFLLCGVLVAVGWGVVTSCNNQIAERSYMVSGTITDSLDGIPVDSAIVSWDDTVEVPAVYSDPTGFYKIQVAAGGPRFLFTRKQGYQTGSTSLGDVTANKSNVNVPLVRN